MSEQKIIIGNCLDILKEMPDNSIDVCVTSPPYWALRDYGSEPVVWGGQSGCKHEWETHIKSARGGIGKNKNALVSANKDVDANNRGHPTVTHYCTKCGAWKGQLGLEPTPVEYIDHLMMIFDEVKRVLKPTGACWVNIGDTYAMADNDEESHLTEGMIKVKAKSLIQIPSRFAIAMTDRGWILRNECIWQKPNAMPISAKDRFTVDFEKFFFFTKERKYYFIQQKEPLIQPNAKATFGGMKSGNINGIYSGNSYDASELDGKNKRTTWAICTQGSSLEHCAMFPMALIETPIKACCPPGGTVLDPFCGSGTTLEYCFDNDINAIGIEINPIYEGMIKKRARTYQKKLDLD